MAAAALSVRGLATALVVLRGALIRTGIGALIVGAGELVYQFTRLVSGAGGFGEAMSLLKDLAVEVWERIRMGAAAAGAAATAMFFDLKADAASGMQSAIESVVGFGNTAANTFEGAYEAIKAIWGLLPAAIGDLAFQAANSLVDGVEAMLNGVVSRINGFIGGINQGLEALGSERRITLVPDLDLGEIENRFEGAATAATTAAQTAFDRAFEDNPLTAPDLEVWRVNWADASQRVLMRRGAIGQIRRGRLAFVAEVRSLAHVLGQTVGRTFQATCDAALGDARCGVDLENTAFKGTGAVIDLLRDRAFTASGLGAFISGWFTFGTLEWTSGANAGRRTEVLGHDVTDGIAVLTLLEAPVRAIAESDAFTIRAGCDKRIETCGATQCDGLINGRPDAIPEQAALFATLWVHVEFDQLSEIMNT